MEILIGHNFSGMHSSTRAFTVKFFNDEECMRINLLSVLLLLILPISSFAGKTSLSTKLKRKAAAECVGGKIAMLWMVPSCGASAMIAQILYIDMLQNLDAANLYRYAYIYRNPFLFPEKDPSKSYCNLKKFYKDFKRQYKSSEISLDEVIDALAFFYRYGADSTSNAGDPLSLFPDGSLETYQNRQLSIADRYGIVHEKLADEDHSESLPLLED
jgi:hypothetical protein